MREEQRLATVKVAAEGRGVEAVAVWEERRLATVKVAAEGRGWRQ